MNSNQIDNTSYYKLPCGKYLEDFIWIKKLNFAYASALKYLWRAGHKDGEPKGKDMNKCGHYISFISRREECSIKTVIARIDRLHRDATEWDGME